MKVEHIMVDWKPKCISGWILTLGTLFRSYASYKMEQMSSLSFHNQGARNLLSRVGWLFPTNRTKKTRPIVVLGYEEGTCKWIREQNGVRDYK
jgi:hypothetical protein